MAVVASALRKPTGEVDAALFYPGVLDSTVTAFLEAYLAQGYAQATSFEVVDGPVADAMAIAYAYVRVWTDVVRRLTMSPSSTALEGEGSMSRTQAQINEWILERDRWLAKYEALIPSQPTVERRGKTQSLPTEIVF